MRKIIKQREVIIDAWQYVEEDAAASAVIVSLPQWQAESALLLASGKQLGVKIGPADKVEVLAQDANKLQLIALEFGGLGEGRGYSQAHILRRRYGFKGELRAMGKIQRDQLFCMARCGIDAYELPGGTDLEAALTAFNDYTVAYQPSIDAGGIQLQQRT